jgi:hypothetical protein
MTGNAPAASVTTPPSASSATASFEDPATGAVLESQLTGAGPGRDVYLSITSTATLPANPYHAS